MRILPSFLWENCGDIDISPVCSCLYSASRLVYTWLSQRSCVILSPSTGHLQACLSHSSPPPHTLTPSKWQELSHIPLDSKHVGQVSLQGQIPTRVTLSVKTCNYLSRNLDEHFLERAHGSDLSDVFLFQTPNISNEVIDLSAVHVAFMPILQIPSVIETILYIFSREDTMLLL